MHIQTCSTTFVTVDVLDTNDNMPIFTDPNELYVFNLSEATSVNSRFSQIQATDEDDGDNGDITYTFLTTGELCLALLTSVLLLWICVNIERGRSWDNCVVCNM